MLITPRSWVRSPCWPLCVFNWLYNVLSSPKNKKDPPSIGEIYPIVHILNRNCFEKWQGKLWGVCKCLLIVCSLCGDCNLLIHKIKYFCFCSTKWLTQYLFWKGFVLVVVWGQASCEKPTHLVGLYTNKYSLKKAISPPIVNWSWEILVPILWFWNLFPMSNWIYFIWWCFEKHWELSLTLVLCVFFIIWAEEQIQPTYWTPLKKWASIP